MKDLSWLKAISTDRGLYPFMKEPFSLTLPGDERTYAGATNGWIFVMVADEFAKLEPFTGPEQLTANMLQPKGEPLWSGDFREFVRFARAPEREVCDECGNGHVAWGYLVGVLVNRRLLEDVVLHLPPEPVQMFRESLTTNQTPVLIVAQTWRLAIMACFEDENSCVRFPPETK